MGKSARSVCWTSLVVILAVAPSAAGADRGATIRLAPGWQDASADMAPTLPNSIGEIFDEGSTLAVGAGYRFTDHFELAADFEYGRLAFDPETRARYSHPSNSGHLSTDRSASVGSLDLTARVRYPFGHTTRMSLYAIAGGGPARVSFDVLATERSSFRATPIRETPISFTDTGATLVGGVGIDGAVSNRLTLGVEVRYRRIFTDDQDIFSFEYSGVRSWSARLVGAVRVGD